MSDPRAPVEQRGRIFLAQNLIDPLVLVEAVEPESQAGRAALDVIVANVVDQFGLLAEPRDLGQGGERDRGAHRVPTEPQDGMTSARRGKPALDQKGVTLVAGQRPIGVALLGRQPEPFRCV
jgi:hypothetical protein